MNYEKYEFYKTEFDFYKQGKTEHFNYEDTYKRNLKTTKELCLIRFGWLSSFLSYEEMQNMSAMDYGCGSGEMKKNIGSFFMNFYEYDINYENGLTYHETCNNNFDIIFVMDVIEHIDDINFIFNKLNWKYAMISFPETPSIDKMEDLYKWRHFKPNEHIWCLNQIGFKKMLTNLNVNVIGFSNFEDNIRVRWDKNKPNISTFLLKRGFK